MKANLVCKGGGIKGIALVGAISKLEEQGYEWENIAGTSAGAIVASLLAVGYNSIEIKEILYKLDYTKFKDRNKIQSIPLIGEFLGLLTYKGIHAGDFIELFLAEKFKAIGKTKFKDISVNGKSKLKIIASDVSRKELLILPDDLTYYGIDPMEFEISKAIRMSLSLPFFFNPVKLNYKNKASYIVDGGLLSNFPIWIFDNHECPDYPTFGLNLLDDKKVDSSNHSSTIKYILDVIQTSIYTNEDVYFKEMDTARIIRIPTLGISTTNFNLTDKELDALFQSGYRSAKLFLQDWNFDRFINNYWDKKGSY